MMSYLSILAQQNKISPQSLPTLEAKMLIAPDEVDRALEQQGVNKQDILRAKGEYYSIPVKMIHGERVAFETLRHIPEESALHYKILPLAVRDNMLEVGIVDPDNIDARDALSFISTKEKMPYRLFLIHEDDFKSSVQLYKGLTGEVGEALNELNSDITAAEDLERAVEELEDVPVPGGKTQIIEEAPVTKIVATIVRYATEGNASDIHIEPMAERVRVRFRVDGVLNTSLFLPSSVHRSVVARVKILSDIKLDERRKPQDGRFSAHISGRKIDFRVSTFPTQYGEKVVIRILDQEKGVKTLDELGLRKINLEAIRRALGRPYGMIIISGPTGSGKTTTLYGMLNEINRDEENVLSLEDPIEYNIPGVSQSQVMPQIDYTFANGLRTTLRQDPDIIMVGEIRDKETAQLAIQAALTGHLVLTTLHTNSAIGVVPRLVDMGVDPYLIAPTVILVIAQRLVRRLCPGGGKSVPIEGAMKVMLEKQFQDLPERYRSEIPSSKEVYSIAPSASCPSGTRGRLAVFEVLEISKDIEATILKDPTDLAIEKVARESGFMSMKEDAIIKAFAREIPFEEVNGL